MTKAKVTDLRKAYPDLEPDKDYPPLKFKSLKGKVSAAEWEARVDCACAYRLVRIFNMDDLVYNHISARIPGTEHFLLNPMGLMYDEICASSLIKVDLAGKVLWEPEFPEGLGYKFNPAGYVIHSAVHEAKPDIHCVIHTHSLAGMAVGSLKSGLLPMTQTAMRFTKVAYHDYEGVALELDERARLIADLGDCEVMILRNHGILALGATVGAGVQQHLSPRARVPVAANGDGVQRHDRAAAAGRDRQDEPPLPAERAPALRPARVAGDAAARRPGRSVVPELMYVVERFAAFAEASRRGADRAGGAAPRQARGDRLVRGAAPGRGRAAGDAARTRARRRARPRRGAPRARPAARRSAPRR